MRLFISVNLPASIKEEICNRITALKIELERDIRWVREENWHITLKFLGELEEKDLGRIKEIILSAANNKKQQSISFSRIAAFPAIENPRVLFVGIGDSNNILQELYRELEKHFSGDAGSYTPHLTIGRVKDKTDRRKVASILKEYRHLDFSDLEMKVNKISLMESILMRKGPLYNELFSVKLMEKSE